MKVLIASDYYSANYYVRSIVDELRTFTNVITNVSNFWLSSDNYSIVHIQWPEELFDWKSVDKTHILQLEHRLKYFKNKGIKIVATYHNSLPHRKELHDKDLYNLVYNMADAIVHLGHCSLKETPNKFNIVIEHPNYEKYYHINNKLQQKGLFFSFGTIRDVKEEWQIIKGFIKAKMPNTQLVVSNSLIVKKMSSSFRNQPLKRLKELLIKFYLKYNHVVLLSNRLNDNDVAQYFNTADVIISPRMRNLNSGVIYMGFTFGKVVIGPAIGNIKEHLDINNNPSFEPNDINSIAMACKKAINNTKSADLNLYYSKTKLKPSIIAKKHFELYSTLIKEDTSH